MAKRTQMMTERQRMEALLKRQRPDRVPIWHVTSEAFSVVQAGGSIADAYNNPKMALEAQRKACQDFGWVFIPYMGYCFGAWEFGGEIKWPSGEFAMAPTVTRFPVETPDDVMNMEMPDVKNSGTVPIWVEFYKMSSQERLDNEPFNNVFLFLGPFTLAGSIAGVERFGKWLIRKPEAAHRLLRLATDYLIGLAQYWKDTFGIDGVLPFGAEPTAANQIISLKQFEQFALPYIKEIHEKVLAMGYRTIYCHICGEQNLNLPYWAQIPMGEPGIASFGHEVDLETAADYFPNDVIMGNLDPAIVQAGTSKEVYEASKKAVKRGKKLPGGFIFSVGCDLPPRANPDNIMAMTKAVNDFGWYE